MITLPAKVKYYRSTVQAEVCPDFIRYYRALIPKYREVYQQRYDSHITIVRPFETPDKTLWGKHEDEIISFEYEPIIRECPMYYWIDVYSPAICVIRRELGLSDYRFPFSSHHITIGNKGKHED